MVCLVYMVRTKTEIQAEIAEAKELLAALKAQRLSLVSGGASEWETRDGDLSRRVRNMSLNELTSAIASTKAEIEALYAELDGYGGLAFSVSPAFPRN